MTDDAVEMMFSPNGNLQLGADVGVAVGPLGRALEADVGAARGGRVAPIYTYSLSKGLYAGISLDGKVVTVRGRVNEKFYGREVSPTEFLTGQIPTPPAARPLYDALQRCHVYATNGDARASMRLPQISENVWDSPAALQPPQYEEWNGVSPQKNLMAEYGEVDDNPVYPPAANDQHSYAGMSDITSDPGY